MDQLRWAYIFCPRFSSQIFRFLGCSCQNQYQVLRIVEYSTISMLDSFKDTLANMGLPEAWLVCDSNYVTQIEDNCVNRE